MDPGARAGRAHEHPQPDPAGLQSRSLDLRVGDDYYIATSTFEWFPGVQIHHSRDLANWRLLTRPLSRAQPARHARRSGFLRRLGAMPQPCDGLFWLIYTDVKRYGRTSVGGASGASLRDFHNYLVTARRIDGDWSDPIYLNCSGFDPSLFHDDDGRKCLVNMLWDHRPGPQSLRRHRPAGILAQARKLVGESTTSSRARPSGSPKRRISINGMATTT